MTDEQLQREEDERLRKIDHVIDELDADASDDQSARRDRDGDKRPQPDASDG